MYLFRNYRKNGIIQKLPSLLVLLMISAAKSFSVPSHHSKIRTNHCEKISISFHQTKNSNWNVGDDWDNLSNDSNSIDSSYIFNVDAAGRAAVELEQWMSENDDHDSSIYDADGDNSMINAPTEKDDFVANIIDVIQSESIDPNGPALYDTLNTSNEDMKSISVTDEMGKEISLLVRCNERPDQLLVDGGKALPDLSDEQKYDISQLVSKKLHSVSIEKDMSENSYEYEPTDFLFESVKTVFRWHATELKGNEGNNIKVMDYKGIASWLSKSLGEFVAQHDKRIAMIVSKYATYGSGFLTEQQFVNVYLDPVMSGLNISNKIKEKQASNMMKRMKLKSADVMSVWRDFQNHGISPPIVSIRKELQAKLDAEYGTNDNYNWMEEMDECEILEWKSDQHLTRRPKSSHELVELSSDHKTPKRMRDGEFVFIDEESCIGCVQCTTVAPSAFKMLDSGRAQTFQQSNSPEVTIAVSTCPVNCMHNVAFHELKELEIARDSGDKQSHIPLHVARRCSDMNHKSSWYHQLKQKCFTSKSCPQKGCFDCPFYGTPGSNPQFKKRHASAERIRAQDIINSGEADDWRKTADL